MLQFEPREVGNYTDLGQLFISWKFPCPTQNSVWISYVTLECMWHGKVRRLLSVCRWSAQIRDARACLSCWCKTLLTNAEPSPATLVPNYTVFKGYLQNLIQWKSATILHFSVLDQAESNNDLFTRRSTRVCLRISSVTRLRMCL